MENKPPTSVMEYLRIPNIMQEAAALSLVTHEQQRRHRKKTATSAIEKSTIKMSGNRITNLQELVAVDTAQQQRTQNSLASYRRRKRLNQKRYRDRLKLRAKAVHRVSLLRQSRPSSDPQRNRLTRILNGNTHQDKWKVTTQGSVFVTRRSMKTLKPGEWLSDEVSYAIKSAFFLLHQLTLPYPNPHSLL
jgi:hypothetical protein